MCGITGILSFDKDLSVINRMTAALQKRGPDGSGVLYSDISGENTDWSYFGPKELPDLTPQNRNMVLALGHTRLSIIDINERSSQPMCSADARYWIVYNGEIFNYIELRKELIDAGYEFKTESDTEVVINAYDYWGVDCLNKFNGMWAFCIYDKIAQKLFLSRDRFGEKPLYYARGNNFFVFGSEIKSIFESGVVDTKVSKSEVDRFIDKGPIEFTDGTFFQNILRLPPGHFLMVEMVSRLEDATPQKYYSLKINTSNESYNEQKAQHYAKRYYELLKDSVRLRIRADVPIGSALSGGMDSSSIVYLINEINREDGLDLRQKTYSCVYKDNLETSYCDESYFIELVASTLGVENYQISPLVDEIQTEHTAMIKSFECPPENTCMSGWWTYKLVQRDGTKVTLDGQGADEQLTGYIYYFAYFLYSLSLRDFIREVMYCWKIPGAFPYVWRGAAAFGLKFLLGNTIASIVVKRVLGRSLPRNLNEVLYNDFKTGLVNLFNNADRGSMAHSVESRMPFVDYRLVEFLASVPACYKIHKGWSKYLARKAFTDKLPEEICWRQDKMGWPIPEDAWFKGQLGSWLDEECGSIQEIVSQNISDTYETSNKKYKLRALNLSVVKKCFGFKVV